jgi:succinate dehydrogenase / fumarate reductase iron-sulfur subunit
MVVYPAENVSPDMSFLEMLDVINRALVEKGEEAIAFDSDCREGICGTCCLMINGIPHGPERGVASCQVYMRNFPDGSDIYVEPWRARAFPVIKDLCVDRSALDRIVAAGGYVSVNTGGAQDGNSLPVSKDAAETAMDAAACIGCGACVAACKNASAMLFTAAKVAHLALLPQGDPERYRRVVRMIERHDEEGFGTCTNYYECEAACPKKISVQFIAQLNREYLAASFASSNHKAEAEEGTTTPVPRQQGALT